MRHRVHGRKLGRTSAHRKALFRNQLTALFTHERIITTVAKAKELRPIAERMVTVARTGTLAARRKVATMISDREIARRLFDEIAPRFADRPGGYTRIMRLGRRHGDNAELAIIEFIDYELADHQDESAKDSKGSILDRAKGMFGGGAGADGATEADDDAVGTAEVPAEEEAVEASEPTAAEDSDVVEVEAAASESADAIEEPASEEVVEVEVEVEAAKSIEEVSKLEEAAPTAEPETENVPEEAASDDEEKEKT